MRSNATEKYLTFLDELYRLKRFEQSVAKRFKVSNSLISTLVKMGIVKNAYRGMGYEWIGESPSVRTVNAVRKAIKERNRRDKINRALKAQPRIQYIEMSEDECVRILKASKNYVYEIYRLEKTKL